MRLTGKGRIASVIGWPVSHSVSPALHGFWLEQYDIDGVVVPMAIRPEDFETCLRVLPKTGLLGTWITLPHKETAFHLCDHVDEAARQIGAVNTLAFEDGSLQGFNTDGYGFIENVKAQHRSFDFAGCEAGLLGAGGAARSIAHALIQAGCSRIRIANRTAERAQTLKRDFQQEPGADHAETAIELAEWSDQPDWFAGLDILINTTSLGMIGQSPLRIDLTSLPPHTLVCDIVYNPLVTALLKSAERRGNPVCTGIGMLIHQGRPGFKRFFGLDPQPSQTLEQTLVDMVGTAQ